MPTPANAARYAWYVVALLFPVALLNYLDRQMLATMKASMVGDIPSIANKADWGLILGCFKWTYALLSPFAGYVADRVGKHRVIASSLFVWSLVTWWTGHVTSFQELLAARALMGVSEAFYIPAALALIADYHFGDTRSRAVGVHQTGIYIGQILGGFAGYVAEALREVPSAPREIAAGRFAGGSFSAQLADGWYGRERSGAAVWAWSAEKASIEVETAGLDAVGGKLRVRLELRGISERPLEVAHAGERIWSGQVQPARAWLELPPLAAPSSGPLRLELRSPAAPVAEAPGGGGRALGFAVSGVEVTAARER